MEEHFDVLYIPLACLVNSISTCDDKSREEFLTYLCECLRFTMLRSMQILVQERSTPRLWSFFQRSPRTRPIRQACSGKVTFRQLFGVKSGCGVVLELQRAVQTVVENRNSQGLCRGWLRNLVIFGHDIRTVRLVHHFNLLSVFMNDSFLKFMKGMKCRQT